MQKFAVLFQKELVEGWKTYKIILVFAACIILGLAVPFWADATYHGDPLFNPLRSGYIFSQFIYVLMIIMAALVPFTLMSTVAKEVKDGLAATILVKPVGRGAYILSKLLAAFIIFALAITIGMAICWFYAVNTTNPLDPDPVSLQLFLQCLGFVLLYMVFAISLTILCSTIFNNRIVAGGIALALLAALFTLSYTDPIREFMPSEIVRWGMELVYPYSFPSDTATNPYWTALGVNIGAILIFISSSILIIKKKEI
ncbi:MAG: ABC transporter permease [Chloroflexi bacterium]|nr:ABC transporter permease [Chloroflexota bacterium]